MSEVLPQESLHHTWRSLSRGATILALLAAPSVFAFLQHVNHWAYWKTALVTFVIVVILRASMDWVFRKLVPQPSLFGVEGTEFKEADIVAHRRRAFWRFWARFGFVYATACFILAHHSHHPFTYELVHLIPAAAVLGPKLLLQGVMVVGLFFVNFLLFMGPMLFMGVSQIKTLEPGDANFGVTLDDVRGQKEPKAEIKRVVEIWQSGEEFEKLGGKRERGMLFLGNPGVGKSMMAKGIATSFNAPFITIPGSGFASTFIGVDSILVRVLARKAKKAARKWGGNCIVFIDEIDAVGRSRNNQVGGGQVGGMGGMMGGMMGGQMALNQLLVTMDSIDSPPAFKMFWVRRINNFLDGIYFVPRRVGGKSLRIPPLKPSGEQVYWLGATNIDLEALDPALVRAGRMGRHIWFRTPTKEDRKDVFDLYMSKVSHDPELDSPERRDEIARITQGVSPASIEQICSMALINAQNDKRTAFTFEDLVQALTTLESGTAVGVEYTEAETLAVARHEAGHAAAGHIYRTTMESSRLSIKMRGNSLGHHQYFGKEERFGVWRSEDFAALIHGLAAMAAEYVFYGENGRGVSGDLQMTTNIARSMATYFGMSPYFSEYPSTDSEEERKNTPPSDAQRVQRQFEFVGKRLLAQDSEGKKFNDPVAAQFMGHAFVTAWNFIRLNKDAVDKIATTLVEEKEIFGDELMRLLDNQNLQKFDPLDLQNFLHIDAWPVL